LRQRHSVNELKNKIQFIKINNLLSDIIILIKHGMTINGARASREQRVIVISVAAAAAGD